MSFLKNTYAKVVCGTGALLCASSAFAEGQQTPFETALDDIKGGITDTIDKIVPVVGAIVVAAIAIWAIPYAWKKLRKGA